MAMWNEKDYETEIDAESGLTYRVRMFCDCFMSHGNRVRALREAGFRAGSHVQARKCASFLLKRPDVSEWVKLKTKERVARLGIQADHVLTELAIICHACVGDYRLDEDGHLRVRVGVPEEALRAVSSVKTRKRTITRGKGDEAETEVIWEGEFKLFDKLKAAELLCRHLGLVSAELPPLEVLLNRLPPMVAAKLRQLLAQRGRSTSSIPPSASPDHN